MVLTPQTPSQVLQVFEPSLLQVIALTTTPPKICGLVGVLTSTLEAPVTPASVVVAFALRPEKKQQAHPRPKIIFLIICQADHEASLESKMLEFLVYRFQDLRPALK